MGENIKSIGREPEHTIQIPRWILFVRFSQLAIDIAILVCIIWFLSFTNERSGDLFVTASDVFSVLGEPKSYLNLQIFIAASTLPSIVYVIVSPIYPSIFNIWCHFGHVLYSTFWWFIGFVVLCTNIRQLISALTWTASDVDNSFQTQRILASIIRFSTFIQFITFIVSLVVFSIQFRRLCRQTYQYIESTTGRDEVASNNSEVMEGPVTDGMNSWRAELPTAYDIERSPKPINLQRVELPITSPPQIHELDGGYSGSNS